MKTSKKSGINENSGVVSPGIVPIARLSGFFLVFFYTLSYHYIAFNSGVHADKN